MSWCHGGLPRTVSMVPVPPFYCHATIAYRLQLHGNSFLATTEGSSSEAFLHGF